MTKELQVVLAVIVGLATIATVAGGLYAVFKSSAQDARIKRLQDERDDYLSRLNYIEPKVVDLEQKNNLLMQLHNPTAQLERIETKQTASGTAQEQILTILTEQQSTLRSIESRVSVHPDADKQG